jgi:hypothetical protein
MSLGQETTASAGAPTERSLMSREPVPMLIQGSELGLTAVNKPRFELFHGAGWLAAHDEPASYWDFVKRANPCMGAETLRCAPRRRKTATGMRQDGAPPARWNTS